MKLILAMTCAALIGGPAIAAELQLKCNGWLVDAGAAPRPIEFALSVSGRDVTLQADPTDELGGQPNRSVLQLVLKKSDARALDFESVQRSKRSGGEARARVSGTFFRSGSVHIFWWENPPRHRYLSGKCEFLVGGRGTMSPGVT